MSDLRKTYPLFEMAKKKIDLPAGTQVQRILDKLAGNYQSLPLNREDGLKIDFPDSWVHLRKSNTEPIIRVYSEAHTGAEAQGLADRFVTEILDFVKNC